MADDNEYPESPLSELAAGAVQMHEMLTSYVAAGFTRAEALQIIISMLVANFKRGTE